MKVSGDTEPKRGHPSLVRKVAELARREQLFAGVSKALVMVSGGQDSLTLLHVLATRSLGAAGPRDVHALHVNYHLRGAESDADEALVVRHCTVLGVELTVVHRPLEKKAGNVQEEAREARRAAAEQTARQNGCEVIALGHTADDQVETLLYRMGRYGGLSALAGMSPNDPPWVRPLLSCRREETAAYCVANGLEFARDRGNADPTYARTGIREAVLPAWEVALPGAVSAACRTAEVAAEVKDLIDEVIAEAAADASIEHGLSDTAEGGSRLSARALLALSTPVRRLLLHDWLARSDTEAATRATVMAVESLLRVPGSASRSLAGGWQAVKEYDVVGLRHGASVVYDVPDPVRLPVPGVVEWGGVRLVAEQVEGFRAVDVRYEAIIDAESVSDGLQVRGTKPGDRFRPLGAPGSRRLKELFIDLKVPSSERGRRPLVVCGERIVWVCGIAVADDSRVTRDTSKYLRLSMTLDRQEG